MGDHETATHRCGVYRAICRNNSDPTGRFRIQVRIPSLFGNSTTDWALPCRAPGNISVPAVGDLVWIIFEEGDESFPVWLGVI